MLESDHNELHIDGKRGAVLLAFNMLEDGRVIGRGCKRMLMSGLKPFEAGVSEAAIDEYVARKEAFFAA